MKSPMQILTQILLLTATFSLVGRAEAQVDTNGLCTVSILNQTAYVQDDGTWIVPNIPSNMGPVRARVTCIEDGQTSSGESDLFTITTDRQNSIPIIALGSTNTAPVKIAITTSRTTLTSVGDTHSLTVTAFYDDSTTIDVSSESAGVLYLTTNPEIATVDTNGVVRAQASGRVIITALYDGTIDTLPLEAITSGDSDGDGLPDDFEVRNGLDPNDPVDALEDPDRDGLASINELERGLDPTNSDTDGDTLTDGDEVTNTGTHPALFDTDGDGLSDGLELQVGSNPLDPTSFNLADALVAFDVTPPQAVLVVDTLTLDTSQALSVTGTLLDGTTLDLASRARGTQYLSSDLLVCNFGGEDGRIFAGQDGTCQVNVTNNGFAGTVDIEVTTFTPIFRAALDLPGYANNVDVDGPWVFVAAGAAGLLVIDAADKVLATHIATLDTPGNANDVKVRDGRAYLADGESGFLVIDISQPEAPSLLASLQTPGEGRDVSLQGEHAFLAAGDAGLHVIDVSNPAVPVLVATLAIPGQARGVDIEGDLAVVAAGEAGLHVIDVSDPALPTIVGSLATTGANDVDITGSIAWLADLTGGLRSIDLSSPTVPRVLATVPGELGGFPQDVQVTTATDKAPPFALTAEIFFANAAVPIIDVSDPTQPLPRAVLDFGVDFEGTGLATSERHVYLTAADSFSDTGTTGDSRLFIGQFLTSRDDAGESPSVTLLAPTAGQVVPEGELIQVEAEALDDIGIFAVRFLVDGEVVAEDRNPPFVAGIPTPEAPAVLTLTAQALDFAGNQARSESVDVQVVAPSRTTVVGSVADATGAAVEGASVLTNLGADDTTDDGGFFRFDDLPADQGDVVVFATAELNGATLRGQSAPTTAVSGGFTDVGEIRIDPARDLFPARKFPFYEPGTNPGSDYGPFLLVPGDFNGDGVGDRVGVGFHFRGFSVLLGQGGGRYSAPHITVTALQPTRLVSADLDADGFSDLVLLHEAHDQVSLHRGLGDGSFEATGSHLVGVGPIRVAVADLDEDGQPDVLVLNRSGGLSLLRGRGQGLFDEETRLLTDNFISLLVADLNRDGHQDLALGDSSENLFRIYAGRGDGTFDAPAAVPSGGRSSETSLADVDVDGIGDLLVHGTRVVWTLLSHGDGTFADPVGSFRGGEDNAREFRVRDLDQDGWPDLAVVQRDFEVIHIMLGDGTGAFGAAGAADVRAGSIGTFDFEDVDDDGLTDLLVSGGGGLKVFRASGGGVFAGFDRYRVTGSGGAREMAAADLNGDGLTDLVQGLGPQRRVFLGRAEGGFQASYLVAASQVATSLWIAEVTRDGIPDLVSRSQTAIEVLPGRGDGTFDDALVSPAPTTLSGFALGAILGDFSGDGLLDVAATRNDSPGEVILMVNRGDGVFVLAQRMDVGAFPRGMAVADFNGDDWLDLVVAGSGSNDLAVLLNQGGTFASGAFRSTDTGPEELVTLDANADGHADLVIQRRIGGLRVLLGTGEGSFIDGDLIPTVRPRHLRAADLDRDGRVDLVAQSFTDDVAFHRGRDDGTFAAEVFFTTGMVTTSSTFDWVAVLVPTDLNGDGRLDLVVRGDRDLHFLVQE